MALSQLPVIRSLGKWSHSNPLALPTGALVVAEETVLDKEGSIEKRRGFNRYGAALSGPASVLAEYLGRLLVLDGTSLKYDSDGLGTWIAWSGSFSPPAGVRMRFLESNGNVYFLTDKGVFYNDALAGTPRKAGVPQGLDAQLTKIGTGGSWFLENTVVGYRHLWKHKDANGNDKPGAPSHQERIANAKATLLAWSRSGSTITITHTAHGFSVTDTVEISDSSDLAALPNGSKTVGTVPDPNTYTVTGLAGGAASGTCSDGKRFNVRVTFTIPAGILEGDTWELYRTDLSASAADSPRGDHRLITSAKVSTADLTAGVITVTDTFAPSFLKENLYTNSTSEGETQANHRPPLARFVIQFEGHTFYGGSISREHFKELQLLDVAGLVVETSSITITLGATVLTYTFSSTENQGLRKFQLFTAELTLVQNIEKTVKSLQKIINRDPSSLIYAHYISGEDDAPGRLLLETKEMGTAAFTVIANNATTGGKFTPNLTTAVTSENDFRANGIRRSKAGQPEAVPRLNDHRPGRSNAEILGMVALLEAVLIWKGDGIFKLSGKTDGGGGFGFLLDDLDPTVILKGQNTLVLLNNAAIAFTSQGVLRASQGPPLVLSRPQVETELKQIAEFDNFSSIAHAIAYESDRKWIFFHPLDSGDTVCRAASIYDYSAAGGGGWTNWKKQVACGHVLTADDKLYLGHAVDPFVLQERKSLNPFTAEDYLDEDIPATITATSTTTHPFLTDDLTEFGGPRTVSLITVTYTYSEYPRKGFLLSQGASRDLIDAVEDLGGGSFRFTMRNLTSGFTAGAATVGLAIRLQIEWAPVTGGNPFGIRQTPYAAIYLRRQGGTHRMGFQSDAQDFRAFTRDIVIPKSKGWGIDPWGSFPWGDSTRGERRKLRTFIPLDHQKSSAISIIYENFYARSAAEILGLGLEGREIGPRSEKRPA